MATTTRIEWADMTINPIIGCSKCSPGCRNCYAERMAIRLDWMPATRERYSHVISTGKWNGTTFGDFTTFTSLGRVHSPKRIFIGSMGDLFHESVTQAQITGIFNTFKQFPQHVFMLLTKRADRMREMVNTYYAHRSHPRPFPNVWLGVTAERQMEADTRIPELLNTQAAVRYVSIEPMLGSIYLKKSLGGTLWIGGQRGCCGRHSHSGCPGQVIHDVLHDFNPSHPHHHHDYRCQKGLDWVIVGGETGPRARVMHPTWPRRIRDQCREAGVPFFFKQWGKWRAVCDPVPDDPFAIHGPALPGARRIITENDNGYGFYDETLEKCVHMTGEIKKLYGHTLDGREWREFPK